MTEPPSVSCVILCHNYGRYLDQAIVSCLEQEPGAYRLGEVLVIDDGSTDETAAICNRWEHRIRVIRRSQQGFGPTLTDAIRNASSEWVATLDADDWFHRAKLRTCAPLMTGGPLLIEHQEYVVSENGQELLPHSHPGGNTSTLVVNRKAALDLLPVTNEIFFHALHETGRGTRLLDPLTFYRVHPHSMTDRHTPGASQDYRSQAALELVERLKLLDESCPTWATARSLQQAGRHFRALAARHRIEAAVQRGSRTAALLPLGQMLVNTIASGEPLWSWLRAARSVMTRRALVRLAEVHSSERQVSPPSDNRPADSITIPSPDCRTMHRTEVETDHEPSQ